MAGKGYLTFDQFKEKLADTAGMAYLDALIVSKILGKKIKMSTDKVTYLRIEPKGEKYKNGASIRIKQYTRSAEAIEELLDEITSGDIQVCRYYNNATLKGQPSKGARYHVAVQWVDAQDAVQKVEQKGNSFNMNIVTIAALLRWKGVLLAPGQKEPEEEVAPAK